MFIRLSQPLCLASKSPRRKQILKNLGIAFKTGSPRKNDPRVALKRPATYVKQSALLKALHGSQNIKSGIILGCDTVVYCKGRIMNKPASRKHAESMVRFLSGRSHAVYTGMALFDTKTKRFRSTFEKTLVTFRKLRKSEIRNYIKSGDWADKAGGYGIQTAGAFLVKSIKGCYYNVVGLPVEKLLELLRPYLKVC
jgi:septum formation protein